MTERCLKGNADPNGQNKKNTHWVCRLRPKAEFFFFFKPTAHLKNCGSQFGGGVEFLYPKLEAINYWPHLFQ